MRVSILNPLVFFFTSVESTLFFLHIIALFMNGIHRVLISGSEVFFAVLLSPVLDGFDQLSSFAALSTHTKQCCCRSISTTSRFYRNVPKNLGNARAAGAPSLNATAVLWRPPRGSKVFTSCNKTNFVGKEYVLSTCNPLCTETAHCKTWWQ